MTAAHGTMHGGAFHGRLLLVDCLSFEPGAGSRGCVPPVRARSHGHPKVQKAGAFNMKFRHPGGRTSG